VAQNKIRLGVIGANVSKGWGPRAHLPALVASPDFELTAVCTTREESARASKEKFGAKMAFHDYRDLLKCPDIDAVAVVLRVALHYEVTMAALDAGKHVFTEWPLGKTTSEAKEMCALAQLRGVRHMVGLQARANPAILYARELVAGGYVGEVMACYASVARDGVLQRPSDRTWQKDVALGATTLTIACGHTIDALRFIVGDFTWVSAVVSTQAKQWYETDTKQYVDVTAPDNVLVNGRLAKAGVASVHVAAIPHAGSGYRMEIYGSEGTLVLSSNNTPQFGVVRLQGAQAGDKSLQDLDVPPRHVAAPAGTPPGDPRNVGQLYVKFAEAIRSGVNYTPNFDTAVEVHDLLDAIAASSKEGREMMT